MITKVIFRKWNSDNSIIALFPELPCSWYRVNECSSYEHMGQHGSADYNMVIKSTTPANPIEYHSLHMELTGIGYELDIRERQSPAMRKRRENSMGMLHSIDIDDEMW